jgi:tetratricopeptide (TPR) repeat protein
LRALCRFLDRLLLGCLVVIAFLLGCYEMGDSDVWWHLRGGQWILEHGRVPGLDPFTFGSADKPWIDIHWAYEVVLALTYRAGGTGALVLLGAAAGCGAFLAALSARRRDWPAAVAVLCWLPTFVLFGFRLDPRPEIFSLLYLGCFLAVIWRLDDRPALAWVLPALQVLWVNTQGLFVFGPILLGLFVGARAARLLWRRWRGTAAWGPAGRRWWLHVGGAGVAVLAACLVNPYFVAGARFPLDLFPKVAESGNIYKRYIDELMSPRDFVSDSTLRAAGTNWFFLSFFFLLLVLPVGFLFPAVWRAWQAAERTGKRRGEAPPESSSPWPWFGALAGTVGLLALSTLTLSGAGAPAWVIAVGDNVPILLGAAGVAAAFVLRRRSAEVAALAGVGGLALALWVAWLQAAVLGGGRGLLGVPESAAGQLLLPLALAGLTAGALVLRLGGDLFRILLAAAFVYLGLQALQNWSRFALVAGTVLTWQFSAWAAELAAARPAARPVAGWCLRAGLAAAVGVWLLALATDRYYVHTGEPRHFALREQPLEFAHEAAVFAGQPGLPERALVYGLGQTGVYVFHNAPGRKPFMDGRLEMPDLQTFQTYINVEQWLRQHDPRWEGAVVRMGNPLLLLEHENNYGSEALLLTHPDWRCVYHDALASVFVPRAWGDATAFPTVDLAARHFRDPAAAPVPPVRGAAAREVKALFNLAASFPRSPEAVWRWRVPALLRALDRGRLAVAEDPNRPDVWVLLGNCCWDLNPEPGVRPPTPAEDWNVEQGLYLARATYCLRRALSCQADNAAAWRYLFRAYGVRGMADAQLAAGEQWLRCDPKVTDRDRRQVENLRRLIDGKEVPPTPGEDQLPAFVTYLLRGNRPEAAVAVLDATGRDRPVGWDWAFAERAAGLYLHLGRPADARRVLEEARGCPSAALRHCRVACTRWVEGDMEAAARGFEEARTDDPRLGEACWALAVLHAERGDAGRALRACRDGLHLTLTARQRSDLEAWQKFLAAYAPGPN